MLSIDPAVFDQFPGVLVGTLVVRGLDNSAQPGGFAEELRAAEGQLVATVGNAVLVDHPKIAPWREAYRAFGAKPKKYPSSIEALVRRVLKGSALPSINPLVDLYNVVSMRHLLPVGGEDLAQLEGPLVLRIAGTDESAVELLGRPEPQAPVAGEVIYADDRGAVCRRWNWREAARTCLTAETTGAVLVVEALPPTGREELEAALLELESAVVNHCGAKSCERAIHAKHGVESPSNTPE